MTENIKELFNDCEKKIAYSRLITTDITYLPDVYNAWFDAIQAHMKLIAAIMFRPTIIYDEKAAPQDGQLSSNP